MRFILLFLISLSIQAQIQLGTNFSVNTALPIDNRTTAVDIVARNAIDSLRRYEGLIVYVIADGTHYALIGGVTNSDWQPIGGGGGGLNQWQASTSYVTGDVVWLSDDNQIYRALSDFTSGVSFDPLNWQVLASQVPIDLTTDVTGVLPIANGGTGSATQNFVDLTTNQSIAGEKTFTSNTTINPSGSGQALTITHNSNGNALDIVQNGSGFGIDVDGAVNIIGNTSQTGNTTQTGTVGVTGSLAVDNITIDGNEISSTDVDGNISLNPNGVGEVVKIDDNGNSVKLGANPQALNLLRYPSFEESISEVTCTSCTASQQTTGVMTTPNNVSLLQAAFSASTGSFFDDENTGSEYLGVQGKLSIWLKTDQSGVVVYPRCDATDLSSLSVNVASDNKWHLYEIPFVMCSTSNGWKVEATTSITGNVYADDVFVGASDARTNIGVDTPWTDYTPATQGIGTPTFQYSIWRRVGDSIEIQIGLTTGTVTATEMQIGLPSGLTVSSIYSIAANVGMLDRSVNTDVHFTALATAGDGFLNFGVRGGGAAASATPSLANSIVGSSEAGVTIRAKLAIANWSASTDIYSSSENVQTITKTLSADVTTNATTVSDLTFTDLVIGAEYEVSIGAAIYPAAAQFASLDIYHDSVRIGRAGLFVNTVASGFFATGLVKFKATANTLTFVTNSTGSFTLLGDGTQSETFAQLRRLDVPIVGLFKDVVTSPGSSNGKPVDYDFYIAQTTGAVTDIKGDIGISSCTVNASDFTCTIADKFLSTPSCVTSEDKPAASQVMSNYYYSGSSSTSLVFPFTLSTNGAASTPIGINVKCSGVQP